MRIRPIELAWRRSLSSSMICACTVTSSAVVGSSAMSTLGSSAIAMAIMMRWRMPPENWCGKSLSRSLAAGMRTFSISSRADFMPSLRLMPRCTRNISAIWKPTV